MEHYEIYKENGLYYADEILEHSKMKDPRFGGYHEYERLLYQLLQFGAFVEERKISFRRKTEEIPKFPHRDLTRLVIKEHNELLRVKKALKSR